MRKTERCKHYVPTWFILRKRLTLLFYRKMSIFSTKAEYIVQRICLKHVVCDVPSAPEELTLDPTVALLQYSFAFVLILLGSIVNASEYSPYAASKFPSLKALFPSSFLAFSALAFWKKIIYTFYLMMVLLWFKKRIYSLCRQAGPCHGQEPCAEPGQKTGRLCRCSPHSTNTDHARIVHLH